MYKLLYNKRSCGEMLVSIRADPFCTVENPQIVKSDRFQHPFDINLWAGILNGT